MDGIPYLRAILDADKIEAQEKLARSQAWELAFIGDTVPLAGIQCRVMRLQDWNLLLQVQSPFLCGGIVAPEAALQFLWALSPDYSPDENARALWVEANAEAVEDLGTREGLEEAIDACDEYVEYVFADAPKGGSNAPSAASFVAYTVDTFASEYGWTDDFILSLRLPRIFQYLACIRARKGGKQLEIQPARARALNNYVNALNSLEGEERRAFQEQVEGPQPQPEAKP